MDATEAEDLKRAIALSLEEAAKPRSQPTIIDLSGEDDDEGATKAPQPPAPQPSVSSFLSERAQLERERLERRKRLRKEAGLDDDDEEERVTPPAKRQQFSSSSSVRADGDNTIVVSSRSSTISQGPDIPTAEQVFWDGELRQIANRHADPRKDGKPTFRLTEILGKKSDLSFAIISSYSLMVSWIYEFFDPSVPVILVAQPDESGQASIKNILPNWVKTTPFLRNGRGCMHMKFMLLFYKSGRLRVVVSTANLVDYDYRDIENTAWLQDVPLRPPPIARDPKVTEDFPTLMQHVLHAVHVHPALSSLLKTDHPNLPLKSVDDLRTQWDWSKVKVHLVASIAGKHEGWPDVLLTGHTRLMKAVRNIGMRVAKGARKELVLECQGSSLGTYSTQWMNEFHWSARGESAGDWLDEPKTRRAKLSWPPIKIIFPSLMTVRESVLGEAGGGTMFCRRNQWSAAKYPRELFYHSKSKAGGVLMHSKMIIASFRDRPSFGSSARSNAPDDSDTEDDEDEIVDEAVGWAYVGSHNFTPSAWGNLSGSAFNPTMNIVNYELGVVFPLRNEQAVEKVACWERPPKKYKLGEDLPWMQEESAILREH